MRDRYWSNSRVANFIRGTPKLKMGTAKEWREWHALARKKPIRYWLAEKGMHSLQNFFNYIPDKFYDFRSYVSNRFLDKTHALTSSSLKKGEWHDLESRFYHSAFDSFIDFVEVELGGSRFRRLWAFSIPKLLDPKWRAAAFSFRGRFPELGVDRLIWESRLTFDSQDAGYDNALLGHYTPQAKAAQEIMSIYIWLKFVRPNRPDAYQLSGYSKFIEENSSDMSDPWDIFDMLDNEDESSNWGKSREERSNLFKAAAVIQADQKNEDIEMMHRIIKILPHCWS